MKSIDRIIDALPSDQREQTKSFLANSLHAVVTQNLIKTPDGRGRRAVAEIMVMNRAIAKLIQTEQTHQIPRSCRPAKSKACSSWTRLLLQALTAKLVDPDDAYRYATDRKKFERFVTDTTCCRAARARTGPAGKPPTKITRTAAAG